MCRFYLVCAYVFVFHLYYHRVMSTDVHNEG